MSMTWAAQFYGSGEQRERWTLLVDSIRTGKIGRPGIARQGELRLLRRAAQLAELFNQTMTSISELTTGRWSPVTTSAPIPRSSTWAVGTAHCWPPSWRGRRRLGASFTTCRRSLRAPQACCASKVADRVRIAEGSFFDSVPTGGDAYILKNIIHDWPDEKAVQILRNVRTAAGPRATVLLIELVIPKHDRDFPGKWVDLEMLLNLGARNALPPSTEICSAKPDSR